MGFLSYNHRITVPCYCAPFGVELCPSPLSLHKFCTTITSYWVLCLSQVRWAVFLTRKRGQPTLKMGAWSNELFSSLTKGRIMLVKHCEVIQATRQRYGTWVFNIWPKSNLGLLFQTDTSLSQFWNFCLKPENHTARPHLKKKNQKNTGVFFLWKIVIPTKRNTWTVLFFCWKLHLSLEKGKPGHQNISPEKCKFYVLVPANKLLLMEILFSSHFFSEKSCLSFYHLHTSLFSICKVYATFMSCCVNIFIMFSLADQQHIFRKEN